MKNENLEINKDNSVRVENKITRKEAIKKAGFMAASAATMMILLSSPNQASGRGPGTSPTAPAPPPERRPQNDPCSGPKGPWK
jgi:hypothetical protein